MKNKDESKRWIFLIVWTIVWLIFCGVLCYIFKSVELLLLLGIYFIGFFEFVD